LRVGVVAVFGVLVVALEDHVVEAGHRHAETDALHPEAVDRLCGTFAECDPCEFVVWCGGGGVVAM